MVLILPKNTSRKGKSIRIKAKDASRKHILGVTHRLKRNLPYFVTNWLNISDSVSVDHQNFLSECVIETTQTAAFSPDDVMMQQTMMPSASSPTVPVYRNFKIPQHYQYKFQYTAVTTIKFETVVQKFIIREPPCYPDEANGPYHDAVPCGITFLNDGIPASTSVEVESGQLEWQAVLTIERSWHSQEFDAEIVLSCDADLKIIYTDVALSLLDDDGEAVCKKRANGMNACHSGTPTAFHVSRAFREQDLRDSRISKDLSYFFKVVIHSGVVAKSQEMPFMRCDENKRKTASTINFTHEDKTEIVHAIDGDVTVPAYTFEADAKEYLKTFTASSVQALLRHVAGVSQDDLYKIELNELLESFHLANKFQLPAFLAECKKNTVLQIKLEQIHLLVVLAFVYGNDIRFTCQARVLLIDNLSSMKKSQDFITYLRRYPLAFVNTLLCNLNGMKTS